LIYSGPSLRPAHSDWEFGLPKEFVMSFGSDGLEKDNAKIIVIRDTKK
jgi:hypothetical protein